MNKILLSMAFIMTAFIICVGTANAQEKPITLGIKGGVNLATFQGDIKDTKSAIKYQFGITADIALNENLYVLSGIEFQTKGAKLNPKAGEKVKYNPMYLQVPVHLGYKIGILPNTRLVINAGPYVAYGIGGKIKGGESKENFFGDNRFKRLDYGVGGGLGLEFGKLAINAGYDFGLANISDVKGTKVRNRNPYVTLGVKF